MDDGEDQSYLDYEAFLDPSFSPTAFANTLVLTTNNASDSPLDLKTPLSRVLFDVQEVDGHINNLARSSALPLLSYTRDHVDASDRILHELEAQVTNLSSSYARLEREVIARYEVADDARLVSERLLQTIRLGRVVSRSVTLGRQLEAQMTGFTGFKMAGENRDDHRVMVRAVNTILSLRQIFATAHPGGEAEGLTRITAVRMIKAELVDPADRSLVARADQIISQFSMSSLTAQISEASTSVATRPTNTFAQTEDTRNRATSALTALYLLSPLPKANDVPLEAALLVSALQEYLRRATTSSVAGLSSGLAQLPRLDRTLLEISARCQNIVALEMLLDTIRPPPHPLLQNDEQPSKREPSNLLQPVLQSLDTSSLPSYFWRSMATQMTARVQKILKDGGVSARTLRSNREKIRDALRECVNRGLQLPPSSLTKGRSTTAGNWEREAAVMIGSVVNPLGR